MSSAIRSADEIADLNRLRIRSRIGEGVTEGIARAGDTLAETPVRSYESTLSTAQRTALGLGGVGALGATGVATGLSWGDYNERLTAEEQRQLVDDIRNDPNLSSDQKASLLDELAEQGALSMGSDDSGTPSIVDRILPDSLFSSETILLLIFAYLGVKLVGNLNLGTAQTGGSNG